METLHPKSGFASQTSLSAHTAHTAPATPPYTPAKLHKRRFERSDSPASSIHPAETQSPAKKVLKRTDSDSLIFIELPDSEVDSLLDVDVVSPAELEEVEDALSDIHFETDDFESDPDPDSDSGISSQFARLDCSDRDEESEMTKKRKERRLSKRTGSRVFKRPHSESANSDTEPTDNDTANDRSGDTSVRRLRRRVQGPAGGKDVASDRTGSPGLDGKTRRVEQDAETKSNDHMENASELSCGSA